MYCFSCGAKVEKAFNYCSSCGTKVENCQKKRERSVEASEGGSHGGLKRQTTLPTFAEFTKAKSEERQSNFKPSVGKVTLNIGLMEYVLSELKPCRGGSLPLKVPEGASYDDLLSAALKKRRAIRQAISGRKRLCPCLPGHKYCKENSWHSGRICVEELQGMVRQTILSDHSLPQPFKQ